MIKLVRSKDTVRFPVRARPASRRAGFAGEYDGALKVLLTSAPEKGKANAELVRVVARMLGVPQGAVRIVKGETSRNKIVEVFDPERKSEKVQKPFILNSEQNPQYSI